MLSKLLKSKKRLDAPDPADRLAAITALDDDQAAASQATLAAMVRSDTDDRVRRAAFEYLSDESQLAALLDADDFAEAAAERLGRHLLAQGSDTSSPHRHHPLVARSLLCLAPSPERIAGIDDPVVLIDVLLRAERGARDRLLDAPLLKQSSALTELERRTRNRDKTLNRLARTGLDAIRTSRTQAQHLQTRLDELLDALERSLNQADISQIQKQRALLVEADSALADLQQLAPGMAACGEPLSALADQQTRLDQLRVKISAEPAAADPQPVIADLPAGIDPFIHLVSEFERLEQDLQTRTDFDALAATRQTLTEQWLVAADHQPPSGPQHAVFERISHAYRELADAREKLAGIQIPQLAQDSLPEQIPGEADAAQALWQQVRRQRGQLRQIGQALARLNWPDWAPLAEPLSTLLAVQTASQARIDTLLAQAETERDAAEALLATLDSQVEQGQSQAAQASLKQLRAQLRRLPEHLAEPLNRRLGQDAARLGELRDWQTFVTTPKREALCEAIARLADAPLPPADQAQRIKNLRAQWRALGPITQAKDRALLETFNQSAERAFEPCRAYFAEQAEVRAANLAAREQICAQLERYLEETDWPRADYKAAEKIMRTARDAWRPLHPVDRGAGNKIQARFESLQARLHDHIRAEWERNLETKRGIVAEAEALLSSELSPSERAAASKALQRRWQAVGPTPRRPDQQLWQALRRASDRVFAGLDDARAAARDAAIADERATGQLLAEFAAAVAALDADHRPEQRVLSDFQTRFESLPLLPERSQRAAQKRFDDLARSYQFALRDAAAASRRNRLRTLQTLDESVSAQERARAEGAEAGAEPTDALLLERWTSTAPVATDVLQRMTIEAEIAAGLDSPPADRDTRLAIQVDIMNSGMGRRALRTDARALAEDWCRLGPKLEDVAGLRSRFFAALDVLEKL
ncbi:MAG: DUF349 domain-containing protein [Pseudomonadales bacterium]|nr:DUF349 domain-containing protein [Pseudomonadales bacterium]